MPWPSQKSVHLLEPFRDLIKEALENVNSDNLRAYLKELTKEPHIAGHPRDNELIEYIRKTWTDMGLDRVELTEYDFYLSWPNQVRRLSPEVTALKPPRFETGHFQTRYFEKSHFPCSELLR